MNNINTIMYAIGITNTFGLYCVLISYSRVGLMAMGAFLCSRKNEKMGIPMLVSSIGGMWVGSIYLFLTH